MKWWIIVQTVIASFIFFPSQEYGVLPDQAGLAFEAVSVPVSKGVTLANWYLPAEPSEAALLFFHGNAGNISGRLFKAREWVERGFSVFLVDYRSYGKSTGKISSENDIYQDAEASLAWLQKEKKLAASDIILYGESIGSAPAVMLAEKHRFRALILEAPFTSIADLAKTHFPFIPPFLAGSFQFRNIDRISNIKTPVFILHGESDETCPYAMGSALYKKAPAPKDMVSVPGGSHNDLPVLMGGEFYDRPIAFIRAQAVSREHSG